MSRNGSGTYERAVASYVAGTTINQDTVNQEMDDIATALTGSVAKNGETVPTANLPMGTYRHTGVGNGSARTDYAAMGQVQDGKVNWVDGGGTADAITATYSPAITALVDGQLCHVRATAANATATPTFSPNSLTARTIVKNGGVALVAGDIVGDGHELILRYDLANTRWELLNPNVILSGYQPLDALLIALAAQTTAANKVQAYSGDDAVTLLTTGTASGNIPLVGTKSATLTLAGLVELATTAEAVAGSDDTVVPTILKVREAFNATGTAPVYACRAWINFDGTSGAIGTGRGSGNVSSVTDNGVGDYTINFATAMTDENYAVTITAGQAANSIAVDIGNLAVTAPTATALRIGTRNSGSGVNKDVTYASVAIFR